MTDAELILLVVKSGGSVRMTSKPGASEQSYLFPNHEALMEFLNKYREALVKEN